MSFRKNEGNDNDDDDQEVLRSLEEEEENAYLEKLAASFDHSEFERNVRHVIRLRRHSLHDSGPTKEEYYQAIVEAYKKQQQEEAEAEIKDQELKQESRNQQHLTEDDINIQKMKAQMSLMSKNNTIAAKARKRIHDRFGEDFSSAGHALLHGSRLPETAAFADFSVTSTGSRATLWSRTVKQWRRDKNNKGDFKSSEDERANEAMASVDAKVKIEDIKSRITGDQVQNWTEDAINERLPEKTRGVVGRIQSVIDMSKKMERRRLRLEYLKAHPDEASREETLKIRKKSTVQQHMEAEIFRLANEGGDFTKKMSPELHGMWLRSLLPGQQIGGMSGEAGSDFDKSSDDDENDNTTHNYNDNNTSNNNESENPNLLSEQMCNTLLGTRRYPVPNNNNNNSTKGNTNTNNNTTTTKVVKLHKAKVDQKMLERESIRERAKRVLFGGVTDTTTPVLSSDDDDMGETNNQNNSNDESIAPHTPALSSVANDDTSHILGSPIPVPMQNNVINTTTLNQNDENDDEHMVTITKPLSRAQSSSLAPSSGRTQSRASSFFGGINNHNNNNKNENSFSTWNQDDQEAYEEENNRRRNGKNEVDPDSMTIGGANLATEKTAKDAHLKVIRLLDAEVHGSPSMNENEEDSESRQFSRTKEAAARAKYLKATKHWGDSRHALVWDFELQKMQEDVSREMGTSALRQRQRQQLQNHQQRDSHSSSSPSPSRQSSSVAFSATNSTSVSRQSSEMTAYDHENDSNTAVKKKSERLQKLERTIHLLESGKIGNVTRKEKFHCRLERNTNNGGGGGAMSNSITNLSMRERTTSFKNKQQHGSSASMMNMSRVDSVLSSDSTSMQPRTASMYAPASEVLALSPSKSQKDAAGGGASGSAAMDAHNNPNSTTSQQQKKASIPELDKPYGKYQGTLKMELNHMNPENGKPFPLRLTNMPEPDLFAYQKYAREKNMVIIIRPVSQVVPQLYATPGLHIKGKSISVSLKSSSYRPIDGLIPVNPALGKAYLEAMRREREIEDQMANATGGVVSVALLRRLRVQMAAAGSLTQAFRRDITNALERSDNELKAIEEEYREKLVVTIDKESVSRAYIERFNEAQFLGTTHAKWKDQGIYYREIDGKTIQRDGREAPVFYILTKDRQQYRRYLPDADCLVDDSDYEIDGIEAKKHELHPVMVVTHRMFTVSETTKRIEPDPTLFMIGPDFDGLCYAKRVELSAPAAERKEWAEEMNNVSLKRTMGLVCSFDVEHVKEVRIFTEWKQNHGYESGNTVKTQPISVAAHAVITPDSFSILNNVYEIVSYIRTAWKHNIPLIVNPNWRVVLDCDMMPRLYGDFYLDLPLVDDCGASAVQTRFEVESTDKQNYTYDYVKKIVGSMHDRAVKMREDYREKSRNGPGGGAGGGRHGASSTTATTDEGEGTLEDAVKLVVDKKEMAEFFFKVRRFQLLPPIFKLRTLNMPGAKIAAEKSSSNINDENDSLPHSEPSSPSRSNYGSSSSLANAAKTQQQQQQAKAKKEVETPSSTTTNNNNNTDEATFVDYSVGRGSVIDYASALKRKFKDRFYSEPDGRTKWDASVEDMNGEMMLDAEFESFRKEKVSYLLSLYEAGKKDFLYLHREKTSIEFIAILDDYLFPEPYVKTK